MKLLVTHRFRLFPNKRQERQMEDTLETCRRLYNSLLADRKERGTGFYEQEKSLVALKSEEKFLRAANAQVLQDVVLRLDKAFQAFFAGLSRHPRFKREGRYNSFTYPQLGGFKINGSRLKLSKIGSVKVKLHREITGNPKRCTIIRDVDQWFACIIVEREQESVDAALINAEPPVGVDLGTANLAVLSDGTVFHNPKHFSHAVKRINTLQKSLSKKRGGSHKREKTKLLLAKAYRKVRRQRDDTAHKVSRYLADTYSCITFENLKILNMVKNHHLASAITDSTWGKLRTLTAYKAERRGGRVILVNPAGTSQKCSECDEVVPKDLSVRVHRCPRCGLILDRDVNAARNVLKRGLERALVEEQPLLVQRRVISRFAPVKQEASGFIRG